MAGNRAAIYARYSAGSGQTDQSIEGQVRECTHFIEGRGLDLVATYADRHITGRTDRRPEFQRMIADAESGAFDVVVVYTTDRFSRDKYDSAIYKRKLKNCGVRILYAAENIPDGPEGILLEALMEGWAQYYSDELSRKILRGMHDSATKRGATGSTPPIGYRVGPDKKYEIDPDVAPHVVRAFEMYMEGSRFCDISRYFVEHDIRTGRGNPHSGQAIRRLLTSRRYIGEYHWSDVTIPGGMPAIVSEELFNMVQRKIRIDHPPKSKSAEYLLSGKLYCGLCGSRYKGTSGTSRHGTKYYYYKCPNKECSACTVPARQLEQYIADAISDTLRDPGMLDLIADKLYEYRRSTTRGADPEDPAKKLEKIERQLDALALNLEKRPGSETLLNRLDALEAERDDLRIQISASAARPASAAFDRDQLRALVQIFLAGFPHSGKEATTKMILDGFVQKAVRTNKKILIELNVSGLDPLELEDLIGFDQNPDWWTSLSSGRTLICGSAVVLMISVA